MAAHAPAADGEHTSGKAHRSDLAILRACRNHRWAHARWACDVALFCQMQQYGKSWHSNLATQATVFRLGHAQTCIYADPLRLSLIGIIAMFVKANQ
jgi:hypothetical protein